MASKTDIAILVVMVALILSFWAVTTWRFMVQEPSSPKVRRYCMITGGEKGEIDAFFAAHPECEWMGINAPCGLIRQAFWQCEEVIE